MFFPSKNDIPVNYRCSTDAKVTDRREKKRRYGVCVAANGPKGEWEQANRGADQKRGESPSRMFPITFTSLRLPPAPSPSCRCLITPRCRAPRSPQRDALAALASFVAGRRSLKSENNKIHLTPFTGYGPSTLPRSERSSQKGKYGE